jgi:hypothetical protein
MTASTTRRLGGARRALARARPIGGWGAASELGERDRISTGSMRTWLTSAATRGRASCLAVVGAILLPTVGFALDYQEPPDLSDARFSPTDLGTLDLGANTVSGSIDSHSGSDRDRHDGFRYTVSDGQLLVDIMVEIANVTGSLSFPIFIRSDTDSVGRQLREAGTHDILDPGAAQGPGPHDLEILHIPDLPGEPTASFDYRFTLTTIATPDTLTLTTIKDSFLRRGAPNLNEGANPGLRLQAAGDNRVVVAFDPEAIEEFLAGNTLTTATLVLTIAEIANNWGRNHGRTVDAHPLAVDFAEGDGQNAGVPGSESTRGSGPGVTWRCAADAEIANQATDCDPRWDGGTFGMANAPSVTHFNGLSGEVSWDVTLDVQAGASAWLLKKTAEGQAGQVSYHSKEGAEAADGPDLAPRLILEGQEAAACPQACIAGLEALASRVAQGPLFLSCHFDTDRQAGEVQAAYGSPAIQIASALVGSGHCSAFIRESPEESVNIELTDAEQAACAPLAIDILPGVDETNCDISPP